MHAIMQPDRCNTNFGLSGVGAAWRTAKVEKGSTVVIFGLGAIGLAVLSFQKFLHLFIFFLKHVSVSL